MYVGYVSVFGFSMFVHIFRHFIGKIYVNFIQLHISELVKIKWRLLQRIMGQVDLVHCGITFGGLWEGVMILNKLNMCVRLADEWEI